ncbi:UDP-N-acetylmuramoyl-tripeptide--D-alanyl-D-alanine ligase [Paenibacillus polymyxa]|uniref:UDP-N-acetylmuramoyl-tripeptide--D-alanyl-D- alanine ligase n=1 Tax=Paenibacillus polymyxa TaxID=1406 RepID=UPI00058A1BCF|nr:UDP-N-acetylmuramoyl-tripeptide--D-alanyl-D-alanine ligase [Paenibacillus polymyxa]AJE53245.1 UDP-N-acetylmuramoyl-tripeptide--D-alanyl-D-alanine ligase [Paenibacillus polymyxa]QOH62908.1 UDP-N-acetylmuramoyl-tripeptide--D-alanyl-D-alanine ligase [Paenibacillus polymyxa]
MKRTIGQIASMCGGTLHAEADAERMVEGVFTDSRRPQSLGLFVPLVGERFDGHHYVQQIVSERGATAYLWQKDHGAPPTVNAIEVEDTLEALQHLAAAYLRETGVSVVGITGSNGKTTTKDIVNALLGTTFKVHKTEGNYNNHIGLPLTVLSMPQDTDILILEMGMSGRGEIRLLANIAQPDVAVITNIGESHLLQLGSRTEIARAKLEIASGIKPGGLLIYNGDEPLLPQVLAEPETVKPEGLKLFTFGLAADNDDYPTEITSDGEGSLFITAQSGQEAFRLPLLGQHNVVNGLAALAVARHFNVDVDHIRKGLSSLKLTGMRIEVVKCSDGLTVLNDAYNASPASMKAAIQTLSAYKTGGRKIAVLGDMLELGAEEKQFHEEIGRFAAKHNIEALFTYGALGALIAQGAQGTMSTANVHAYTDKQKLIQHLRSYLHADDIVLVKASRGMRLEEIVDALKNGPLQN